MTRFCELNRSDGIAMATGILFDKRKGGSNCLITKVFCCQSFGHCRVILGGKGGGEMEGRARASIKKQ